MINFRLTDFTARWYLFCVCLCVCVLLFCFVLVFLFCFVLFCFCRVFIFCLFVFFGGVTITTELHQRPNGTSKLSDDERWDSRDYQLVMQHVLDS